MVDPQLVRILEFHTPKLMSISGVIGTAISGTAEEPFIKVFVLEETKDILSRIPSTLDGFPVVVEPTGEIRAL